MNYMKCKYCGKLYVDHDINDHMNNCYPNWNDITGLMSCLYVENCIQKIVHCSQNLN